MWRSVQSILHAARLRELLHHPLLLLRKFLGNEDRHFDDEVAFLLSLLDALAAHPKTFSGGRSRRDLDRDFFTVQGANADLGTERRLCNVQRHHRDHIETIALVELVRQHVESDDEIAGWTVACAFSSLALQSDLRSGINSRWDVDENFLARAHLPTAVASGARLGRNLPSTQADGTRPIDGKPTLAE